MTDDSSQSPSDRAAALQRKKFIGKLIVFGCIIAFTLLKPKVEAWWNARNAPEVAANESAEPELSDESTDAAEQASDVLVTSDPANAAKPSGSSVGTKSKIDTSFLDTLEPGKSKSQSEAVATTKPASKSTAASITKTSPKSSSKTTASTKSTKSRPKLATPPPFPDKSKPTATASTKPRTSAKSSMSDGRSNPKSTTTSKSTTTKKEEPRLGALTLVSRNREVFESTAGLLYGRGSVDRHRLKHVLKHAEDNLSKPVHGVFSGDRDQILEWIDKAYIKGKKGGKGVRVNDDGDRMTYSVDMGEKIGFVGGQVGERKGHPACRYLKLVLEDGKEVVTAYPQQYL